MAAPVLIEDSSKLRRSCEKRLESLREARQPWLDFVREVAEELMPNRLPYLVDPQSNQRGGEQNRHICDAVGHLALDTVAAAIASGTMPASGDWFDLVVRNMFTEDYELKAFLEESGNRLLAIHNQSNASQILPECQKEYVAFGTGAALVVEDDEDGLRLDAMSAGEYLIAEDHRGRVDTCYREFTMTVGQLAEEFGKERLSSSSRASYDRELFDVRVAVVHAIEPDRDGKNPYGENPEMPWRSVYYEVGSNVDQVLDVRGYSKFPVLVWRYGKLPGSAYGYGRGMDAKPHLLRLRKLIYRYGQALAYKSEPPLQMPAGMQQHEVRALPGGKTSVMGSQPIRTLFEVNLELKEVAEEIERTRQQIRDTIGSTLVASLRQIRHEMTRGEAELRTSQDLQEFLPALHRLNEELLSPYIEWLWEIASSRGLLPQQPQALQDQVVIDIEFTSPLARKQRAHEIEAIVRTWAVAGEIAKAKPEVLDNLDADASIRRIAEIEGAPVSTLVPFERMRREREAMQRAKLAEAQAAAAQQGVQIARDAAQAGRLAQTA